MSNYHNQSIENCFKELKTSKEGLVQKEAEKRIEKNGLNELSEEKQIGKLVIFFSQFKSPLIYILLVAGAISFFLREYVDAGVIFGSVFLNTIIGFIQENKANDSLKKLKKMVEHKALVFRNGQEIEIDSSLITIGDVFVLQAGNRVPADARIIEAKDLQINESNLTGESMPSTKSIEKQDKGAALADRKNMAYSSTVIVRGSGKAVVVAIGKKTEIGKIAELVNSTKEEKTPLQIRLAKLSKFIGFLVLLICLIIIAIGIWQGRDFFEMFVVSVAIAVAAIPEGLIVAVTVILVFGMQQILKKKALTRKLVAAETLGSTTVICTDKTGTLTEGKMRVSHIVIGEKEFEVKNLGNRQDEEEARLVSLALQIGMMCNDAVIENPHDALKKWRIIGSPTEVALLMAAIESGLSRDKLLKIEKRQDDLPFSSETKYMATLYKRKDGYVVYEKGAPEKLLEKSLYFYHKGKLTKITPEEKKILIKTYENLTSQGLRVIGAAVREFDKMELVDVGLEKNWRNIDKDLTFVGFIALKDPLRPEAKETIDICKRAGIRPIIITGDHKLTAKAIGREIGINVKSENIITGDILDNISDEKLKSLVKKIDIYARVSPHHKLRIVRALQSRGEVVAMTGDGINDSPALKAADIGISLGNGTDIAKETSDIVLLDNNFKTIVEAVKQGRIIFSNIRKVITYLVSDGFSEVILIIGSLVMGLPLAILPAQILWINIINDGFPNFSLAFEKGDKDIMKRKPILKKENIINSEMKAIIFIAGLVRDFFIFGIFLYLINNFYNIDYIRTVIFASVGASSLMYIFSLRSFSQPIWKMNPFDNLYLDVAISISFFLLVLSIYWSPLQAVMSTTALNLNGWMLVLSTGILNIILIELIKYFYIRRKIEA